ncbi:MAG: hypothetical protein AAGG48_06645 [Planctomycetota bacterium]
MQVIKRSIAAPLLLPLVVSAVLSGSCASAVEILAGATLGSPYGVATIEIPVNPPVVGDSLPPLQVTEETGRIFFPIAEDVRVDINSRRIPTDGPRRGRLVERVRNVIRDLSNGDEPQQQTVARRISFLFHGGEPLRIQFGGELRKLGVYEIVPISEPKAHAEMLTTWWKSYSDAARRQIASADYPAWVENYLIAMLSGRTNQKLPDWYTDAPPIEDELLSTLKLIGGVEGVAERYFRQSAIGQTVTSTNASLPLPPPPRWAPLYDASNLDEIPVEPLATRVPAECFYIRYGSFENFLWFQDLSSEYAGDISRMVTLRGMVNDTAARLEDQLAMKTTQLSRMLGASVVEDQALIGRDLFMSDGASMGVLIQAKNAFLLRTGFTKDREATAAANEDVTLRSLKLDGQPVTLLSSVDNRVRSYMAVIDNFIMVANNESMIRRFIEVSRTGDSLASTAAFRLSRQLMPLERNDVIFAYFSPQMLRGLVSPEYLIELRRRLEAKADIALVHLARLAAAQELNAAVTDAAENQPAEEFGIDELVGLGFLPTNFSARSDGSGVFAIGNQVIDTLRGGRGTFLPIADCPVDAVTPEESEWYARIAEQYTNRFPTIDPIMVGIQREVVSEEPFIERVNVHAEVAPWDPGKYGMIADQLGPPTPVAMQFAADDIIALQAHVASEELGSPTHLFAAIKDNTLPEPEDFKGIINIYQSLRQLPGYLGAWPQPGALDRLPLGLGVGQPIGQGMSRLLGGLYRYTDGQFSVLSFQQEVLQATLPQLAAVDATDSAQVRFRANDLRGSQIEGWVNAQLYKRSRESSMAGANFLGLISRQFKVPPRQAMDRASEVLGARLQCPLGGDYAYNEFSQRWTSTAWQGELPPEFPPANYIAPALQWFRGLSASVTQYQDRLVADAVIDIQRQ